MKRSGLIVLDDEPVDDAPRGTLPRGDVGAEAFRRAFRALASGVAVVTFHAGTEVHGFTATSVTSVSMAPPLALFCVANHSRSRPHLHHGKPVGISFLGSHQTDIARFFASSASRDGHDSIGLLDGAPIILDARVNIAAVIEHIHPAGDHAICVCRLEATRSPRPGAPLIYFARDYYGHRPLADDENQTDSAKTNNKSSGGSNEGKFHET